MRAAAMRCRRRRSPWHAHGSTRSESESSGIQPVPLHFVQGAGVRAVIGDHFTGGILAARVMASNLVRFLSARPDSSAFLLTSEIGRTVEELFAREGALLPQPYKIFPADETQPPILGFPVAESAVMRDLDAKLDRWLTDEVQWQISRTAAPAKEKAQISMSAYLSQLGKVAENAMLANLLADYHAVFWLAHSFDLCRQFSSIPRRVSAIDTNVGRTQGDALKYRIFSKWVLETREQLNGVALRCAPVLDGEE